MFLDEWGTCPNTELCTRGAAATAHTPTPQRKSVLRPCALRLQDGARAGFLGETELTEILGAVLVEPHDRLPRALARTHETHRGA